jgi:hypothetical protein
MPTVLELHYFHRPEGGGGTLNAIGAPAYPQHTTSTQHKQKTGSTLRAPSSLWLPSFAPFFGANLGIDYLLESLDFISACEVSPLSDSAYFLPPKRI